MQYYTVLYNHYLHPGAAGGESRMTNEFGGDKNGLELDGGSDCIAL